jgi:PGF-CTERM protein
MRRRALVAVAVGLALAAPVVGVALAHVPGVSVDTQVSASGTVLVENAQAANTDGYVTVHADDGGAPGEVLGVVSIERYQFAEALRVPIDEAAWAEWGDARRIWVTARTDEGASGFDPDEDPILTVFGQRAATPVVLGKGQNASVLAERFDRRTIRSDRVVVRQVTVPRDGLVVVKRATNGTTAPLGATPVAAGTHTNVSVDVDGSVFADHGRRLTLVAQLYTGGDTVETATPLRVGDGVVGSTFRVDRRGPLSPSNGSEAGTPPPTPEPTPTESLVVTPEPTASAAETTEPTPTPTGTASPAPTTGAGSPGFGVAGAVLAVVTLVVLAARRRGLR